MFVINLRVRRWEKQNKPLLMPGFSIGSLFHLCVILRELHSLRETLRWNRLSMEKSDINQCLFVFLYIRNDSIRLLGSLYVILLLLSFSVFIFFFSIFLTWSCFIFFTLFFILSSSLFFSFSFSETAGRGEGWCLSCGRLSWSFDW